MNASQSKIYIDLSKRGLIQLPSLKMNNLQYLYLDNNKLTELPANLFMDAPLLKWLDIRNNCIENIPKHSSLETILLQNNRLTFIPSYISTIKSLKSLQLSGNPITYPKKSVISSGTDFLLTYLAFEYQKEESIKKHDDYNLIDVSLTKCDVSDDLEFLGKIQSNSSESDSGNNMTDDITPKKKTNIEISTVYEIEKNVHNHTIIKHNSNKYLKSNSINSKNQIMKVQENFILDIWKEKRREIMNKREKIIQDRRTLEALKNWRENYKESQKTNSKIYVLNLSNIPYDTDLNCVNILTRADLEKDLPNKYKKNIRCKSSSAYKNRTEKLIVQKKIDDIIECMQSVEVNSEDWSPRTTRKMITCEIKKLNDIKNNISKLKMINNHSL